MYGIVAVIVKDLKHLCHWISRYTINFTCGKYITFKEDKLDLEKLSEVIVHQIVGGMSVSFTKDAV